MRKLSARHNVKADSSVSGTAFVESWVTEDDLESDPVVRKILQAEGSHEQKIPLLTKRVQEILHEKGYDNFQIQNVSNTELNIDHEQLYSMIDKANERNWEHKTDAEWQALKKQLAVETDPNKRQQIQQRITELEDMEYEGSKVNKLIKTAEVCAVCKGEDHEGEECPLEGEPKKKAYPEDKWQKQKEAVPVGTGEPGWLAYEPYKQSSDPLNKSVLRNEDLKKSVDHLMVNKDPKYLAEVKQKLVDFISQTKIDDNDKKTIINKVQQIQKPFDLMKYYYYSIAKFEIGSTDSEVKADFGFFDGPVDLGKNPKGDWPSVQWMPHGQEDLDISDNITTASLDKTSSRYFITYAPETAQMGINPYAVWDKQHPKGSPQVIDTSDNVEELKQKCQVTDVYDIHGKPIQATLLKIYNHFKSKLNVTKTASKDITLLIKPEAKTFWYEDKDGNLVLDASAPGALNEPYEIQALTKGTYQNFIYPVVVHSITTDEGPVAQFETTINCVEPIVLHLCNKQGWKLTDAIVAVANTCERCLNILLEQVTGEPYLRRATANTHCTHCAEIDPEWDKFYLSKTSAKVVWLYKEGQETDILDEYEREIASKWGPEYNSALRHFTDAIKNGHDKDRAFQYAIAEMEKVKTPIQPDALLEVIELYSTK